MGAYTTNALASLVSTILNLVLWAWMLRIILQLVRADFYNPISQTIWRITRFPTDSLRKVIPPYRNFNGAAVGVLLILALVDVYVMAWFYPAYVGGHLAITVAFLLAVMKLIDLFLELYILTLTVQAIMSWLGPGVNNPASNILWSMNEPIVRPVRRLIPPFSGLDLSFLIVILLMLFFSRLLPLPGFLR
jgi:YggT family protein